MASSTGVMGDYTLGNAGVDLRTHTYKGVYLDSGSVVQLSTTSLRAIGVLQNKPNTGEACAIRTIGTSKLVVDGATGGASANISIGDKIKSNAVGVGVRASVDGEEVMGIALEASVAAGDIIEVALVNRQG